MIHGLVKRLLEFSVETLSRYPMISCKTFHSGAAATACVIRLNRCKSRSAFQIIASCAEWTGGLLSTLLEETGVDPWRKVPNRRGAGIVIWSRSVPMKKALDDAMIVLYQNGERLDAQMAT